MCINKPGSFTCRCQKSSTHKTNIKSPIITLVLRYTEACVKSIRANNWLKTKPNWYFSFVCFLNYFMIENQYLLFTIVIHVLFNKSKMEKNQLKTRSPHFVNNNVTRTINTIFEQLSFNNHIKQCYFSTIINNGQPFVS